ncbi:hypothetical protein MVEN_02153800 [Mycena venus]|uniref:Uncharacterized protein n=1 Tax=Mycena venus TaxID=2733690 RepID=A0A8H6X9J9_9AGAR|nr:hypothetical protein MVEN_02153800 [Mycena venus]
MSTSQHSDSGGSGNEKVVQGQSSPINEDLDLDPERLQELIVQTPQEHPDLPKYLMMLGTAISERYLDSGDLNDLQVAVQKKQEAIELTPKEHPDRAQWLWSLAISFQDRYKRAHP